MNVLVQSVSTQAGVSCFETVRETWKLGNVSTLVSWFILDLDLCDSQLLGKHVRGHNSVGPSVVSTLQAAGPYMNQSGEDRHRRGHCYSYCLFWATQFPRPWQIGLGLYVGDKCLVPCEKKEECSWWKTLVQILSKKISNQFRSIRKQC